MAAPALAVNAGKTGGEIMPPIPRKTNPGPQGEATYQITVQGSIPASYSERLAGMRITTTSRWDQDTTTVLEGPVQDQAELLGLLNNLYEMHLRLLSVQLQPTQPKE